MEVRQGSRVKERRGMINRRLQRNRSSVACQIELKRCPSDFVHNVKSISILSKERLIKFMFSPNSQLLPIMSYTMKMNDLQPNDTQGTALLVS